MKGTTSLFHWDMFIYNCPALSFSLNAQGKWESKLHKKVENDELHSFLTFSDFCLQHYQLLLPEICFKMITIAGGLPAIICKILPLIQMYHRKYKFPCSAVNVHVTIRFDNFISRKTCTDNFRFDGRHCIGDPMAHVMIRKLLYSEFDR